MMHSRIECKEDAVISLTTFTWKIL